MCQPASNGVDSILAALRMEKYKFNSCKEKYYNGVLKLDSLSAK